MLAVDGLVHGAHVVGGYLSGERAESGLDLRPALEGRVAHERNGLIGREVVLVIREDGEPEGGDGTVGGVSGDHVDLAGVEGAVEKAEVHGAGGSGKLESVRGAEAGKAVGALLEFVADTELPFWRVLCGLAEGSEVQAAGVVSADDHGEGVVEAEGRTDGDMVFRGVEAAHGIENLLRVAVDRLLEDGGERGSGVF